MRTSYSKRLAAILAMATGLTLAGAIGAGAHVKSNTGACTHTHVHGNGGFHHNHKHCYSHDAENPGGGGSSLIEEIVEHVYDPSLLDELPDQLGDELSDLLGDDPTPPLSSEMPGLCGLPPSFTCTVGPVTVNPGPGPSLPNVTPPNVEVGTFTPPDPTNANGAFDIDPELNGSFSIQNGEVQINNRSMAFFDLTGFLNINAMFDDSGLSAAASTAPIVTPSLETSDTNFSWTTDPVSLSAGGASVNVASIPINETIPTGQASQPSQTVGVSQTVMVPLP